MCMLVKSNSGALSDHSVNSSMAWSSRFSLLRVHLQQAMETRHRFGRRIKKNMLSLIVYLHCVGSSLGVTACETERLLG